MKNNINKNILNNESGQMAIFVAILFQVLFVLFAMSINVALVVHDKVNLQNATDLAAYYGAQKQAEMLNVIAHQNYQIRQSWKLLSWRYRMLGQLGVGTDFNKPIRHPAHTDDTTEAIFLPNKLGDPTERESPIVCTSFAPNWLGINVENFCQVRDFSIPTLSLPESMSYVNRSIQEGITAGNRNINNLIADSCSKFIAYNYLYGTGILFNFRFEQKMRRELMYGLVYNMMSGLDGVNGFNDLDGNSVKAGITKMVNKNLTFGNKEFGDVDIEFYNSMSSSGLSASNFFNNLAITPHLMYTDAEEGSECTVKAQKIDELPARLESRNIINQQDPDGNLQQYNIFSIPEGVDSSKSILQYSLGFEKNPWNWIYTGVKAKTKTRPLFFPLGEPLEIKAIAFAKPFGGRIGPWYYSKWNPGDSESKGGPEEMVDKLLAPRISENGSSASLTELRQNTNVFPNYSRYPGDELGLRSKLALNSLKKITDIKLNVSAHFSSALTSMATGDSLIWNTNTNDPNYLLRKLEIAAIAPDLFDATYYSIEPNFSKVYLSKLNDNKTEIIKAGSGIEDISQINIRGDLGSHPDGNDGYIDVIDQIKIANENKHEQNGYYFIINIKHVLTGWLHGKNYLDFSVDNVSDLFANCEVDMESTNENSFQIPGGCKRNGGRTGYSVKLISLDLLTQQSMDMGGGISGKVANPPSPEFIEN